MNLHQKPSPKDICVQVFIEYNPMERRKGGSVLL